jgi:hypothetical protein
MRALCRFGVLRSGAACSKPALAARTVSEPGVREGAARMLPLKGGLRDRMTRARPKTQNHATTLPIRPIWPIGPILPLHRGYKQTAPSIRCTPGSTAYSYAYDAADQLLSAAATVHTHSNFVQACHFVHTEV